MSIKQQWNESTLTDKVFVMWGVALTISIVVRAVAAARR